MANRSRNSSLAIRDSRTIMGIDPGLATTGYGVLTNGACRDYGMVSTSAGIPVPQRIEHIVNRFDTLFRRYRPDACAIETLFFKAVGARSVILTAQLRGALFYLLARRRIPVFELTPATIKLMLTGNGRAAKRQMQYMVRALLRVREPIPDHAADALAAAYCLSRRMQNAECRPRDSARRARQSAIRSPHSAIR
jgi:crossover junction endodeoxyribonuclease RuvC